MTMWAYSSDGVTVDRVRRRVRDLPNERLDGGGIVLGLNKNSPRTLLAECGVYPVEEAPRPSDPDWEWAPAYTFNGDVVEQSWEQGASLSARNAAEAERQTKRGRYRAATAGLRQWAEDARNVTVNNGNNTAVTQTLVDRLGVLADRLADLIDAEFSE